MCGFVGFSGNIEKHNREEILKNMTSAIAHRGPDSEGYFSDDFVSVGFRRLSIIDLEGGSQPIISEDGRYLIVFNGEIYNYQDLRRELRQEHGCRFKTESDSETVLQSYIVYGEKSVSLLRGMFAFVIYDSREHRLFGARDYFGIKPFYYANMNGSFLFASEIKAFLSHPSFKKEVNEDALKLFLSFQYTPTRETMFKGVFKLSPGSCFIYDGKNFETHKYFDISYMPERGDFDYTVKRIAKAVEESVDCHQISDVEVGAFLSGGVDSSYIASCVKPMKTYSVGFEAEGFDETERAKTLCNILNMKNDSRKISADEFFEVLPDIQYFSDEPHANLSAVPLYFLAQRASKDLKVVLSGEGADELFGGYDSYKESRLATYYKKSVSEETRKKIARLARKRGGGRGLNFLIRNALDLEDGYIGQAFIMDNEEANEILADKYKSELRYQDITKPYFDKVKGADELHKKLFLDMNLWLPNDILLKADKMTMAHSLELRVPYLDKEIWRLARTLPSDYCIDGGEAKKAFRHAALSKIPPEWAGRKKKGFPVPLKLWLRNEKYSQIVRKTFEKDFCAEFFNRELLLDMLEMHKSGEEELQRKIYTVYSFLLWYEEYFIKR